MWGVIEQKVIQINKASGIEIIIQEEDRFVIHLVTASRKGNNVLKDNEEIGLGTLSELKDKINPGIPVSVVINGKGVLVKRVASTVDSGIIHSVIPNANPNEFYYELSELQEGRVIAIIRKETVDKILRQLKTLDLKIISVSLGFNAINNILPFFNHSSKFTIESDSLTLEVVSNKVIDFEKKQLTVINKYQDEEYLIANQYLKPSTIISFSAATGLLADDLKYSGGINGQVMNLERKEYRFYKLFKAASWTLLIFVLLILLINFIIYNNYYHKNVELAETEVLSGNATSKTTSLKQEVIQKEKFLLASGWTTTSRISLYADRIAAVLPQNIVLSSMQIFPMRVNSDEPNIIDFRTDAIIITGKSDDPVEINQFLNSLKLLPQFKEANLKDYMVRNESEGGLFTIEIMINK
jgi:hypothetical protein